MATTEPGISSPAPPSDVGRHLRAVRKSKGLSRAEVARSAGLTRRELAAYERGRSPVPDSDLWCLAGSCGVDVSELLPPRDRLTLGSDLGALTVGESVARLRPGPGGDGVLRDYLTMVYELRNLPPGAKPPMREEDLATLAEALGGSPDAIEARLHELIGASREEAARLRSLILPPRPIAAPAADSLPMLADFGEPVATPIMAPAPVAAAVPPTPVPAMAGSPAVAPEPGVFAMAEPVAAPPAPPSLPPLAPAPTPVASFAPPATAPLPPPAVPEPPLPAYPPPAFDFATPAPSIGDPAAADRFFGAPQADDPFAPPPPLEALAPPTGPAAPDVDTDFPSPDAAFAAFAAPTGPMIDPFAPPSGPPLGATQGAEAPEVDDLFAAIAEPAGTVPARPDGFVADLGHDLFDTTAPAFDTPRPDGPDDLFDDPAPDAADDPFGSVEMVVLDVGPDGTVVDPAWTPDDAPPEDDPFAVLRVPIGDTDDDETPGAYLDPFADAFGVPTDDDPVAAAEAVAGDAEPDAATTVIPVGAVEVLDDLVPEVPEVPEVPGLPEVPEVVDRPDSTVSHDEDFTLSGDEDPGDDWFDRAAAAADALIAERRQDDPPLPVDEALPPISWSLAAPATAPVVAPEPAAPPANEFVAAGPDWQVGGIFPATAMADDGALMLRRADVRWALADIAAEGDFTVRVTATFTSGAGFGILFRVSADDAERITGYSFDVDPIYSGGGFLVRQWNDSRQHWKPLAHAPVADTARLYGAHLIEVSLRDDMFVATIDGETVMTVPQLSRCSIDAGHEPCRGGRVGVQAWSTSEITVDRLMVAHH